MQRRRDVGIEECGDPSCTGYCLQQQILANQERIADNQAKLDKLIANQAAIVGNQSRIEENQAKLDKIIENQEQILKNQQQIMKK